MLLHFVSFKYKAGVDTATRASHRERLSALKSLDGVLDLKVGEDVVRSPRSYDTGLAVTFPDRAALDADSTNPLGQEHTFTVTITRSNDGSTWVPVPAGTKPAFTWTGAVAPSQGTCQVK